MTTRELADKAGLSKSTVAELSMMDTWSNVKLETIHRFAEACGVNLLQPHKFRSKIKSRKPQYGRARQHQKKMFVKLFQRIESAAKRNVNR